MNPPNTLCRCESCLKRQGLNQLNFTPKFERDVKDFFEGFDIEMMAESLKIIYNRALFDSDQELEQMHKEAFRQVNMLWEGLEALGKS